MKITNTNRIKKFEKEIGLVTGEFVASRVFYKDFFNGVRNFFGMPLKSYAQMLNDAKDEAIKAMIEDAIRLGAKRIINVRFTITTLTNDSAVVLVTGTVVV